MNSFINVFKIENCHGISFSSFDKILIEGFLIYDDNLKTHTLDVTSLLEIEKSKIESCRIIEIKNQYFYVHNRELFEINFSNLNVTKIYSTREESLHPFPNDIVSVGSSNWRTKTQNFSLIKLPNQELLNWEDRRELLCVINDVSVFSDGEIQELFAYDLSSKLVIWRLPFDKGITGRRYYQELPNDELLVQKYFDEGFGNLLKLNLKTGLIIWEIEKSISFYNYDEKSKKLFGLGYIPGEYISSSFEIINVATGEQEMQKDLHLQIPAHLTYYADGYLYFSGYKGDNITKIFGAVDVNTGEIEFTKTIETPNGETYRGSYDRPLVVGNRLYIRDQQKTLHIYERQNL